MKAADDITKLTAESDTVAYNRDIKYITLLLVLVVVLFIVLPQTHSQANNVALFIGLRQVTVRFMNENMLKSLKVVQGQ